MAIDIQGVLMQWYSIGLLTIVLPGLLFFAVIFGILSATKIFGGNRAVHIIIALVIAVLAISSPVVQDFSVVAFEKTGIGLVVLLIVVLLTAMFIPDSHRGGWAIAFYVIGALAALIIILTSFEDFSWFGAFWESYGWTNILTVLAIIGIIVAISVSGKKKDKKQKGEIVFNPWREDE